MQSSFFKVSLATLFHCLLVLTPSVIASDGDTTSIVGNHDFNASQQQQQVEHHRQLRATPKTTTTTTTTATTTACSGYFCDKTLDEIFIVGTHNSLALPGRVLAPNQNHGLSKQFADGIRLFNLDLYGSNGNVYTQHGPSLRYNPQQEIEELVEAIQNDWEAFVVIQLQDRMEDTTTRDFFLSWFGDNDMIVTNFNLQEQLGAAYMVHGQRVLIVTDKNANVDASKGMHSTTQFIVENDYSWNTCYLGSPPMNYRRGDRSTTVRTAKLMNYFCSGPIPGTGDVVASANVNQAHRILEAAREFVQQDYTHNNINMILVDYYDQGNVMEAQARIRAGELQNENNNNDIDNDCWDDGRACSVDTTCGQCCASKSSYWYGKAATACGLEPAWPDGTPCQPESSCQACGDNGYYEWWDSKLGHSCGPEPCWSTGEICRSRTTCSNCCAESARCPWYWFGFCRCI